MRAASKCPGLNCSRRLRDFLLLCSPSEEGGHQRRFFPFQTRPRVASCFRVRVGAEGDEEERGAGGGEGQ